MNSSFRVPFKPAARAPEYQRQQAYPVPGLNANARLSDSAAGIARQTIAAQQDFADQQAKQLDFLGKNVTKAAETAHDLYVDYETSKAKDAYLQYRQAAAQKQAELDTGLQGKDAIDEKTGVQAQLSAWREQARAAAAQSTGGGIAGSLFERAAAEVDSNMDVWATQKVHRAAVDYGNATSKANIALKQNEALALAGDPFEFGKRMGVIKAEYEAMAKRSGYGAEWVEASLQDVRQKTLIQAISDAISGEQLGNANAMIKAYGSQLGGAAEGLRARVSAKGRELEARARAEAERARKGAAVAGVQNLLQQTAGMPSEQRQAAILEALSSVPDTRVRADMWNMAEGELRFQRVRSEAAINAQAMSLVQQTKDMSPVERNQFFVEKNTPDAVVAAAQGFLAKAKTPDAVMSTAKGMYNEGKSLDEISAALGKSFSPDGWAKLTEYTKDKDLQKANKAARKFFSEMLLQSGLDPKNDEDKAAIAAIQSDFESQIENKEFKSRDEQKAWIYNALAKRIKPGMIWDSHYTPREAQGVAGAYVPVPDFLKPELDRELTMRGVPTTDEERQKLYNEGIAERGF